MINLIRRVAKILAGLGSLMLLAPMASAAPAIAIRDVTVIDAVAGVRKHQTIVIRGNVITAVGVTRRTKVPVGARIIDGQGRYVIPGLWDSHVHPTFLPGIDLATTYTLFLANGFTSIRNMGGPLDLSLNSRAVASQPGAFAPHVYIAGPLVDGRHPLFPQLAVSAATPAEVRERIATLKAAGVDFIKLYETLTPETFVEGVRYAHSLGLPVAAHVPAEMDAFAAAKAHPDSLEHMRYFEMSCSSNWQTLLAKRRAGAAAAATETGKDPVALLTDVVERYEDQSAEALTRLDAARCDRLIAEMKVDGVMQTPTLANTTAFSGRPFLSAQWRLDLDYLPPLVRAQWVKGVEEERAKPVAKTALTYRTWARGMVVRLQKAGVPIMAGTDTPSKFLIPGFSARAELELLVQAGLTPMQVLAAATIQPARFMRLDSKTGTIATGKWADLVLLRADPLVDIANTGAIEAVIKDGIVHDRAELDHVLADLKARNADPVK